MKRGVASKLEDHTTVVRWRMRRRWRPSPGGGDGGPVRISRSRRGSRGGDRGRGAVEKRKGERNPTEEG
jgi:hypothetical protein